MTAWQPSFLRTRTGIRSPSLREIYRQCTDTERELSPEFYTRYPAGNGTGPLTPFAGILQGAGPLAGGEALVRSTPGPGGTPQTADLAARLGRALGRSLPETDVAVAVSGGIDSWLLAALLQSHGYRVTGWYLETRIPGYCEREQVDRTSAALGIACHHVPATAEDFVAAAGEFVAVTESPVYNLHPVSKLLLARALRDAAITTLVTGDAADQVFRWDWDCDLLPLTLRCFRAAGIRLVAPFMAHEVIASCRQPCPDKQPVRALAQQLGVPMVPKRPTLFPPMQLPSSPRAALPSSAAASTPASANRIACLSYTTGLLQRWLSTS